MIEIRIKIDSDATTKLLILNSILPENIDQRNILVDKENGEIIIKTKSLSRGRAIMNSYISWIYTIMETIKRVNS